MVAPDAIGESDQAMAEEVEDVAEVLRPLSIHDDPFGPEGRKRRGRTVEAQEIDLHLRRPGRVFVRGPDRGDVGGREAERGGRPEQNRLLRRVPDGADRAAGPGGPLQKAHRSLEGDRVRLRREAGCDGARLAHSTGPRPARSGQRKVVLVSLPWTVSR